MLGDAQVRREYLGGFRAHIGAAGHLLRLEDEDSDEEPRNRTPPLELGNFSDVAVVVSPSACSHSRYCSLTSFL